MQEMPSVGVGVNLGQGPDALNAKLGDVMVAVARKTEDLSATDVVSTCWRRV